MPEKTVMVVEATESTLRQARSAGVYANLSGHEVDFIAFVTHHGAFVAPVKSIQHGVPLNKIYGEVDSRSKTTCYRLGALVPHALKRNCKLPRGRKRVIDYDLFMESAETGELFKHRYHR
jgi:hypothetical protein